MVAIKNAIQIEGLYKTYPQGKQEAEPVLRGIDLRVPEGEIRGIIGKSGAGKSTLVRCISGLESFDRGRILIAEKPLSRDSQKRIGNVFQSFNLLSRRTILENVALPLELDGQSPSFINERARDVLSLVGLEAYGHFYPSQLSGGQRQRVAIARALVGDVDLLLCDEFTSALDPETSLEILSLLRDVNQRLGITILLITHDMSVVREICDTVSVLDRGAIVEEGDVGKILLRPSQDVTKSLVQGLFLKDIPNPLRLHIMTDPTEGAKAIVRLLFSGDSAQQPLIASLVSQYGLPVNIIAGSLDHIRETAFGCLLITMPWSAEKWSDVSSFLDKNGVSCEILGYLP